MRLKFGKCKWSNSLHLSVGISWEDWHLREIELSLDIAVWAFTLTITVPLWLLPKRKRKYL